ncbi:MAG: hydrogenase formation protein HypD, partial [Candidatus Bathyarchaeia archaeon]
VVAGFEPLDVLFAIYMVLKQLREGVARLENEYVRAVSWEGNTKAQEAMYKAFDIVDGEWRGLGKLPSSAFRLKDEHAAFDAREKFRVRITRGRDLPPGCQCHLVMIGKIRPTECPLFMKICTPQKPVGACMVSMEGTCRIWAKSIR